MGRRKRSRPLSEGEKLLAHVVLDVQESESGPLAIFGAFGLLAASLAWGCLLLILVVLAAILLLFFKPGVFFLIAPALAFFAWLYFRNRKKKRIKEKERIALVSLFPDEFDKNPVSQVTLKILQVLKPDELPKALKVPPRFGTLTDEIVESVFFGNDQKSEDAQKVYRDRISKVFEQLESRYSARGESVFEEFKELSPVLSNYRPIAEWLGRTPIPELAEDLTSYFRKERAASVERSAALRAAEQTKIRETERNKDEELRFFKDAIFAGEAAGDSREAIIASIVDSYSARFSRPLKRLVRVRGVWMITTEVQELKIESSEGENLR